MRILAIDPGDIHVGMAWFEDGVCLEAWESTVQGAIELVEGWVATEAVDEIVIEKYVLYPWVATQQSYSEMETSQLIGVLKYIARKGNVPVTMQGADIKKPTAKILRAKKVRSAAKTARAGGHAYDAELHGHYRINNPDKTGDSG